jgi:hypothetical protein
MFSGKTFFIFKCFPEKHFLFNFQNSLKCSLKHPTYEAEDLIKRIPYIPEGIKKRPKIPSWIFN